jgi:hypothetical protein
MPQEQRDLSVRQGKDRLGDKLVSRPTPEAMRVKPISNRMVSVVSESVRTWEPQLPRPPLEAARSLDAKEPPSGIFNRLLVSGISRGVLDAVWADAAVP